MSYIISCLESYICQEVTIEWFFSCFGLRAMAVKGYSAFAKAWSPTIRLISAIVGHSLMGYYPSAKMQSVYSIVTAEWCAEMSITSFCAWFESHTDV